MPELKTLKDISDSIENCFSPSCWEDTLRQDAIKDINSFEKDDEELSKIAGYLGDDGKGLDCVINYIKWKFNITEEEIK